MKGLGWLLLFWVFCSACDEAAFELELDRDEVQAMVEDQFPLVKKNALAELTFSRPEVLLERGEELGLRLQVVAALLGSGPYNGQLALSGRLHYDEGAKSFYLHGARLTHFELQELSPAFARQVEELAGNLIAAYLSEQPLYQLNTGRPRDFVAQYTLKAVRVEAGKVYLKLGF